MATIALPEAVPSTTLGQVFLDGRVWCEGKFSIAGLLSTLGLPGRPLAPQWSQPRESRRPGISSCLHGGTESECSRANGSASRRNGYRERSHSVPRSGILPRPRVQSPRRGHFKGAFNGLDVTAEDGKRFQVPTYGAFSVSDIIRSRTLSSDGSSCERAGCHAALVAKTDRTCVQFYPILRTR